MNLALFDFDGTITTREMFPDFMHFAVAPGRLAVGKVVLSPLIVGYRLGLVAGNTVRAGIVNFGFRGVSETALRPVALERIQWHKAQGDVVVVVSGALDLYLSHWCGRHGLDLVCSELESRDGVLTGRFRGAQCVGMEKPRRVLEKYDMRDFATVYAYGDTREDREMLNVADRKYFRWQEVA
jgi:phosphoserine phosphatase